MMIVDNRVYRETSSTRESEDGDEVGIVVGFFYKVEAFLEIQVSQGLIKARPSICWKSDVFLVAS